MKKTVFKIDIIYFLRFIGDAFYTSFIALYFYTLGFDGFKLGLLLGVIPIFSVVGNLLVGVLADGIKKNLIIIRIMILLELILVIPLGLTHNYYFLLVLVIFISLLNQPYYSMEDGISNRYIQKAGTNYSVTRMCGSIGYCIAMFFGGMIVDHIGYTAIFIGASILYLLSLILWLFIKPFEEEKSNSIKEKIHTRDLLKNKSFVRYMMVYIFIMGAFNAGEMYLSTYFKYLGYNATVWGNVFAVEVAFEIITMFIVIKFVKEKHWPYVFYFATILITLRLWLHAIPMPGIVLLFICPLRGISWGAFLSVHLNLVKKIVGQKYLTKSVVVLAVILAISNAIMNYVGPEIFKQTSYPVFYLILAIISSIGLFFVFSIDFKSINNNLIVDSSKKIK